MVAISSPNTFVGKWALSIVWLGSWSALGVIALVRALNEPDGLWTMGPILAGILAMLLFGYFASSSFDWALADEVLDYGTYLRVRRGAKWEQVDFSRIAKVTCSLGRTRAFRVALRLRTPCAFGSVIRFIPRIDFLSMSLSPGVKFVDDLEARIEAERRRTQAPRTTQATQAPGAGSGGNRP